MNLVKRLLQKICLVLIVVLLWVLDDMLFFLPDKVVWSIIRVVLLVVGRSGREEGLKAFWGESSVVPNKRK